MRNIITLAVSWIFFVAVSVALPSTAAQAGYYHHAGYYHGGYYRGGYGYYHGGHYHGGYGYYHGGYYGRGLFVGGYYGNGCYGRGFFVGGYYGGGCHGGGYYGGAYYAPGYDRDYGHVWYSSSCCYRRVVRHEAYFVPAYEGSYYGPAW